MTKRQSQVDRINKSRKSWHTSSGNAAGNRAFATFQRSIQNASPEERAEANRQWRTKGWSKA
jgi:hypothetical protein